MKAIDTREDYSRLESQLNRLTQAITDAEAAGQPRSKVYPMKNRAANLNIQLSDFRRDHPEILDELNWAV